MLLISRYHSVGDALRHMCALAGAHLHVIPLIGEGAGEVGEGGEGGYRVQDAEQLVASFVAGLDVAAGLVGRGTRSDGESLVGSTAPTAPTPRIKLAVVDHISSKPSIVFPVKEICRACAARGIPTLVDGAHAPGSIPEKHLRIDDMDCDFYTLNFHKWLHAPRPCAGL